MSRVSDDPSWWPLIDFAFNYSYCVVASSVVVVYDWVLTSGQEFDLVWSRPWSLITVLYLCVRCLGVLYCGTSILWSLSSVSMNDAVGTIVSYIQDWMPIIVIVILGVVMIIRLHAMYQGSRKILAFLITILVSLTITTGVLLAIAESYAQWEEFVLCGTYQCIYSVEGDLPLLIGTDWKFVTGLTWEVITLCLAIWIAVKHFRQLQRQSRGWTVKDCFAVLIKTHVLYFAAFAVISCFAFGGLSPYMSNIAYAGIEVYDGFDQIIVLMQLFVLGPRLILSVRAYHAHVLADFDSQGTAMTTIAFKEPECIRESTGSVV